MPSPALYGGPPVSLSPGQPQLLPAAPFYPPPGVMTFPYAAMYPNPQVSTLISSIINQSIDLYWNFSVSGLLPDKSKIQQIHVTSFQRLKKVLKNYVYFTKCDDFHLIWIWTLTVFFCNFDPAGLWSFDPLWLQQAAMSHYFLFVLNE